VPDRASILITGASSGIGAYCARQLAQDGWDVMATARKDADLASLERDGIAAFHLDYCEPDSIARLVDDVLSRTDGRLDALFNNGAHGQPGAVEDLPVDALRLQFEANLFGWHDLTRRVVPLMREQGHGRIVHCSSILGLVPMPWRGAYCASKHALEALALSMRMELAGSGVHVSLIEPGPIRSKFTANALIHARRHIDLEGSIHAERYRRQIAKLERGGTRSRHKLDPDAVYAVLIKALTVQKPKPHYLVTTPAKVGALLKRLLPPAMLYDFLAARG